MAQLNTDNLQSNANRDRREEQVTVYCPLECVYAITDTTTTEFTLANL